MFCNHCGAKNPDQDQAVSCLACGQPQTQIPSSSMTSDTWRSYEQSGVETNSIRRPSGGKSAIFVTVIGDLIQLAITLLVLFHDYGNRDTTVIVSLLVGAYHMITAHLSGEGVLSAKFFLDLSKLIQRHAASDEDESHEDATDLVRRDMPYAWAGVFFHIALAALAAIKLLLTLLL
jgi:hypothetical protein